MTDFLADWSVDWSVANDVAQVTILYFAFYAILKSARGSRFGQVLTGVGILFGTAIAFTYLFRFDVLSRILQMLLAYLAISSVVIFRPEIRRMLEQMGSLLFAGDRSGVVVSGRITPEKLTDIIFALANRRIGALFAIERGISLRGYEENGVAVDAIISEGLLVSIFTEPMPLHDGGAIIRNGRLAAVHCVFPVSSRDDLSGSGMRHRAGVGISEETDAIVIIVSEERGAVSIAKNGRIIRHPADTTDARTSVLRWLRKAMPARHSRIDAVVDHLVKRFHRGIVARKENA